MKRIQFKDNEMLLNSHYYIDEDVLMIQWINVETKAASVSFIDKPKIPVYFVRDHSTIPEYFLEYRPKEELVERWVGYKYKQWDIANELGIRNFAQRVRNKEMNKNDVFLNRKLFGGDIPIEDLLMMRYRAHFNDDPPTTPITMGILDIESDIMKSDVQAEHQCISIAYSDMNSKYLYVGGILRKDFNKCEMIANDLEGYMVRARQKLLVEAKATIRGVEAMNEKTRKTRMKIYHDMVDFINTAEIDARIFETEEELITTSMDIVFNVYKPNTLHIYNAAYDIPQLLNRCEALGIDPATIFCAKGLPPLMDLRFQTLDAPTPAGFRHTMETASFTKILDTAILYYGLRAGSVYGSWNLGDTLMREINQSKMDFSHLCDHIGKLPYEDFEMLMSYNIVDTLAIGFMDRITGDNNGIFLRRGMLCTEYPRVLISIPSTTNVFIYKNMRKGLIDSPEVNKYLLHIPEHDMLRLKESNPQVFRLASIIKIAAKEADLRRKNKKVDEDGNEIGAGVEGGFVSNPVNFSVPGIRCLILHGQMVFTRHGFTTDSDATSMYPSNYISGNYSKSTLVGKIIRIGGKEVDPELAVIPLINRDIIGIGHVYMNTPSVQEVLELIEGVDWSIDKPKEVEVAEPIPVKDICKNKKANDVYDYIRNVFHNMYNDSDTNSGLIKQTGIAPISNDESQLISYYGTAVSITIDTPIKELFNTDEERLLLIHAGNVSTMVPSKNGLKKSSIHMCEDIGYRREELSINNSLPELLETNLIEKTILNIQELMSLTKEKAVMFPKCRVRLVKSQIAYNPYKARSKDITDIDVEIFRDTVNSTNTHGYYDMRLTHKYTTPGKTTITVTQYMKVIDIAV